MYTMAYYEDPVLKLMGHVPEIKKTTLNLIIHMSSAVGATSGNYPFAAICCKGLINERLNEAQE